MPLPAIASGFGSTEDVQSRSNSTSVFRSRISRHQLCNAKYRGRINGCQERNQGRSRHGRRNGFLGRQGFVYSPRVSPDCVVSEMVGDFLNRVFDGEALPLFQHLIQDRGLSEEEIDGLQQTLDELKRRER